MTTFDDRQKAFEAQYARDQDMQFKITSRRNRLLGQWAAKKMGLSEDESEAYAREVIRADFQEAGDEDIVRKLVADLERAGCLVDAGEVRAQIEHKATDARRHFIEAQG